MLATSRADVQVDGGSNTMGEAITALDVREEAIKQDAFELGRANAHLPEGEQMQVLQNLREHINQLDRLSTLEIQDAVRRQFWKGTGAGMPH